MREQIIMKNDFHGTAYTLRITNGIISKRQVLACRKALCGLTDCKCGGELGQRGPQDRQAQAAIDAAGEIMGTGRDSAKL